VIEPGDFSDLIRIFFIQIGTDEAMTFPVKTIQAQVEVKGVGQRVHRAN